MAEASNAFKVTIALSMIFAGSFDTLVYKTQNKQIVTQGVTTKYFFHPFMQVAVIFLGQSIALVIYYILRYKNPEVYQQRREQAIREGKQVNFSKLKIAIPACCDALASCMHLFALNFIAGSIFMMMRGGTIVTTFLFSMWLLKLKPKRCQYVGSFLAFAGIGVVGVTAMAFAGDQTKDAPAALQFAGYLMLIGSLFCSGFQFTYEQTLFNRYHIDPLQMVGFQGVFALSGLFFVIIILNYVPCQFGPDACAYSTDNQPFIEQTHTYFTSITSSTLMVTFGILGIISITVFNVCSVSVTKYINALARSICDVSRTLLIWMVGLIVTTTLGKTRENYRWQSLIPGQIFLQSLGFLMVVGGNLIYNRILKFKCLEVDKEQGKYLGDKDENPLVKGEVEMLEKQREGGKEGENVGSGLV